MTGSRLGGIWLGTGLVVCGWVQGVWYMAGYEPHARRRQPPALELVDVEEQHAIREALPVWGLGTVLII